VVRTGKAQRGGGAGDPARAGGTGNARGRPRRCGAWPRGTGEEQ
jgi:hypothetical protein